MPEAKYIDTAALSAYTEALSKKLSRVYDAKGSAIYADSAYLASDSVASPVIDSVGLWQQIDGNWTKITEVNPGWVYNITNKFTTDSNFIDGGGNEIAAGTNIAIVNTGTDQDPVLKFDLLAMGVDISSITNAVTALQSATTDKQDKELSSALDFVIPDHTVADATARLALTTSTVANKDVAFQEDTQEYYYADVEDSTIVWYNIGNTRTVEGALKLIASLLPIKPISVTEIQAMF